MFDKEEYDTTQHFSQTGPYEPTETCENESSEAAYVH